MSKRDVALKETPGTGRVVESNGSSRWVALAVLCTGFLMIVLDATIVNVALPSIQADLGYTPAGLAWVVNAYLIAFGGFLLLAGRLGDLIGRKRLFLAGLVSFTAASVLCGLSVNQEMLIVARFLQGVGGAMTAAVVLGMIVTMFPAPAEQAKAIGIYGFVATAGASLGLLLSGILTEAISWNWIFLVNLPIGIVTAFAAHRLLASERGIGFGAGADALGAALITSSLMLGVYTIVQTAEFAWTSARTLGLSVITIVLLAAFVWRQATAAQPLLPLRIFASRNVSGANATQVLMVAAMYGMFFVAALFLQLVLGYGPVQIGLAFLPSTAVMGFLSLFASAPIITRFGAKAVLCVSIVAMAAGLGLFALVPMDATFLVHILPPMVLMGIGSGVGFPALMTLAMSDATPADSGVVSGLANTAGQVGGALGVSLLAALASVVTADLSAAGRDMLPALAGGYTFAIGVGAILMAASVLVALFVLRSNRQSQPAMHG